MIDEIKVKVAGTGVRTDTEIARAVQQALEWDVLVPDEHIDTAVAIGTRILCPTVHTRFSGDSR